MDVRFGLTRLALFGALSAALLGCSTTSTLPSWSDGDTREAIISFVKDTTEPGSPHYVPEAERIAVFDNDGTLWAEQPAYVQLLFAIDRIRALAPQHPEWRDTPPFMHVLNSDLRALAQSGEQGVLQLIMATHAGMTTDEFTQEVRDWLESARHPSTGRRYTEMVYQPMLEVLEHLRANGYRTFIVSGGGIDFLRVFAEEVYGIPPEQVIGSSLVTRFEDAEDAPVIQREATIDFIHDKAGKPVAIHARIGRRPAIAFGNSDGDREMLRWTTSASGRRLGVLLRHTDAVREWAYDRESHIGRLDRALDEAPGNGWLVVDMEKDWRTVFPNE